MIVDRMALPHRSGEGLERGKNAKKGKEDVRSENASANKDQDLLLRQLRLEAVDCEALPGSGKFQFLSGDVMQPTIALFLSQSLNAAQAPRSSASQLWCIRPQRVTTLTGVPRKLSALVGS